MRQTEEVRAFKNELKNYLFYKKRLTALNEQLDWCWHQLGADAKSINYDGVIAHSPKNTDREYKIRDEIELWNKKIAYTQAKIDEIDKVLAYIEIDEEWLKDATYSMYAKGVQSFKLGLKYGYSSALVRRKVDIAIKKALDRV